jgi:arabinogalactan oligomer/maltooligosaccharide transport system permease protein
MRNISTARQVATQLALAMVGIFVLIPIWALLNVSFDASLTGPPIHFRLWPEVFSFESYRIAWVEPAQTLSFLGLLKNSMIVSGGAALVAVVFGMSAAYAFARYRFPGKQTGMFVLLLGTLLPPVALMIPLYLLLTLLGIRTSLVGLLVAYTAFAMPFCVWTMRSAFQAVPLELEEAAYLDGASPVQSFTLVTLPLALPSIGVAALIAFLIGYTEFAIGWLFVTSSDTVTLAMAISGAAGPFAREWNIGAALAVLMSAPIVLLFILLRKNLMEGMFLGSIQK